MRGSLSGRTAAFYDLDGTLLDGNVVTHYLFYARTEPSLAGRVRRLVETAVKAPIYKALDTIDRRTFNEYFYRSYEGLSEDRLVVLGEELFDDVLKKRIFEGARELVEGDRAAGHLTVLVSGALDFVAAPVARALGIERVGASRLEFGPDGLATGRLVPPVLAGPEKVGWVQKLADDEGIDLARSRAYADDTSDLPLLALVGKPVAVNPSLGLRAAARAHRWPVIELGRNPGGGRGVGRIFDDIASWVLR